MHELRAGNQAAVYIFPSPLGGHNTHDGTASRKTMRHVSYESGSCARKGLVATAESLTEGKDTALGLSVG
jgi:hypothetical protein